MRATDDNMTTKREAGGRSQQQQQKQQQQWVEAVDGEEGRALGGGAGACRGLLLWRARRSR